MNWHVDKRADFVVFEGDRRICYCYSAHSNFTDEEAAAHARKIAATPQLIEALQNLAYYEARISPPPYGHNCRWCGDCVQRAKDDARAALKAAQ